jgi:hypothetical protein
MSRKKWCGVSMWVPARTVISTMLETKPFSSHFHDRLQLEVVLLLGERRRIALLDGHARVYAYGRIPDPTRLSAFYLPGGLTGRATPP